MDKNYKIVEIPEVKSYYPVLVGVGTENPFVFDI